MILGKLVAPTKKLPQEVQVDQTLRPLEVYRESVAGVKCSGDIGL